MRIGRDSAIRIVGAGLCVAGTLMVGYAGWQYGVGALRADAARRQWEEQQAHATVALARERVSRGSAAAFAQVAAGSPVARLRIPRIRLDEIVLEGVGDDELNAAPGHLPGSALPGMRGNSVISAHRDRHFSRLAELQLGDTILTETGQSAGKWVIVGRRVIGKDTPALFQTRGPMLTLTTCWPVQYFGSAPDRLILSAKPIDGGGKATLTATAGGI
ncbi:MAG TPA: class D sortase [Gemmatimonadaceae bacterium]|jgi:sortase A